MLSLLVLLGTFVLAAALTEVKNTPSSVRSFVEASTETIVVAPSDRTRQRFLDSPEENDDEIDSVDSFYYGPAHRTYPSRKNTGSASATKAESSSRQGKSKRKSNSREATSVDEECSSLFSKGRKDRYNSRRGVSGDGGKGGRRERGLKGTKRGRNKSGVSSVACESFSSNQKSGVKGGVPDREYPSQFNSEVGGSKKASTSSGSDKASVAAVACGKKRASGSTAGKKGRQRTLKGSQAAKSAVLSSDGCVEGATNGADHEGGPSREYPPAKSGKDDSVVENAMGDEIDSVDEKGEIPGDETNDESSTTTNAMATATADANNSKTATDKRVGVTMSMLGLGLVAMVGLAVGLRRRRQHQHNSKDFYADMDDDDYREGGTVIGDNESDADVFVYPSEDELLGPECSGDLAFSEKGYHDSPKNDILQSTTVLSDHSRKYSYERRDDDVQHQLYRGFDSNYILDDLQGQGDNSSSVQTSVSRNTCTRSRQSFNSVSTRNLQKKTNKTCCL